MPAGPYSNNPYPNTYAVRFSCKNFIETSRPIAFVVMAYTLKLESMPALLHALCMYTLSPILATHSSPAHSIHPTADPEQCFNPAQAINVTLNKLRLFTIGIDLDAIIT